MNPNSAHQLFSKWVVRVRPPHGFAPTFDTVQVNVSRFVRKGFGTCGEMTITRKGRDWIVMFLVDSQRHPHDQDTFRYFARSFTRFFREAFGATTEVNVDAKLMAGARLDGQAPDQMIRMPRIQIPTRRAAGALGVH